MFRLLCFASVYESIEAVSVMEIYRKQSGQKCDADTKENWRLGKLRVSGDYGIHERGIRQSDVM